MAAPHQDFRFPDAGYRPDRIGAGIAQRTGKIIGDEELVLDDQDSRTLERTSHPPR